MMNLLVRGDANSRIGSGHVMRCLALAQAWQDAGGATVFAVATEVLALEARLRIEGAEVVHLSAQPGSRDDAIQTAGLARETNALCVIIDGYHFGADEYQRRIKDSGPCFLFVDDNGDAKHYYADIVLNQNIYAHQNLYAEREPYTELLLGTRYALLRREFLLWKGSQREIPDVARKVLVTMGGGDPDNVTLKVMRALQQVGVPGLEARIIVGPANMHLNQLRQEAECSNYSAQILTAADMAESMAWADIAVTAGGSTCWETAFMGLPSCIIIIADNQRQVGVALQQQGAAVNIGWFASADQEKLGQTLAELIRDKIRRNEISRRGQGIVDGKGSERVVETILKRVR